jgi:DNA-binding transcriptional regulator YiaG
LKPLGVGSDQTKISKWEKGRQMPRGAVLTALLAKLKS